MENLQSEIIFIAKFGGIVLTACTHYFYVIKPIAIFNERQKMNRKDIDKLQKDSESTISILTKMKAEHDMKICEKRKSK